MWNELAKFFEIDQIADQCQLAGGFGSDSDEQGIDDEQRDRGDVVGDQQDFDSGDGRGIAQESPEGNKARGNADG